MIPSVEEGKDLMLRAFAAQLRAERPGLTHARSYQLAQEQHPELREVFTDSEEHPTSQPAYQPPLPGKVASSGYRYDNRGKNRSSTNTSWDDVLALMGKYAKERLPFRVQASAERPILVHGRDVGLTSSIWS